VSCILFRSHRTFSPISTGISTSTITNLPSLVQTGTITSGTWQGTAIADSYIASAANWNAKMYPFATSTLSASSPLTGSFIQVGSGGTLGCQTASGSQAGCLSSTDWTTFNNKGSGTVTSVGATYPLSSTGSATPVISSATSSASSAGVLSAADWTTFNSKLSTVTADAPLSGSGTSGSHLVFTNPGYILGNQTITVTGAASGSGTTAITLQFASTTPVQFGGTGATTLTGLLQGNGTGAITGITGTAGQFPYYNGASTLLATSSLFLATSGNVGIGTTSPDRLLTVANDGTKEQLKLVDTSAAANQHYWTEQSSGGVFTINSATDANATTTALLINQPQTGFFNLFSVASTSPAKSLFAIDSYGHLSASSTAPVLSACGTGSPSISSDSNDTYGTITAGTVATTCTLTFGTARQTGTHCTVTSQTASIAISYTESLSALVITNAALGGDKVDYICTGQ
jgi:hypothetical protein